MRFIVSLLTLVALVAACASPRFHQATQVHCTEHDQATLMQRADEEQALLDSSGILYEDEMLQGYLEQVVQRLQAASAIKGIDFRVRVIADPYLNAFAFANGTIYVHTGILGRLDNEAQLAALLAHEMTHCTHRHAFRAARAFGSPTRSVSPLKQSLPRFGHAQDLSTLLGALQSMALIADYTQNLETEADMGGLAMMLQADYEPEEALRLLEHLKWEAEAENIKEPFVFATHPSLEERMENIRRFLNNRPGDIRQGTKNEALFLDKVEGLLLHNVSLDLKAGRYDMAQRGVQKYLTIKGPDGKAYFLLGEIYRQRGGPGDIHRAKAAYNKAILLDASYPDPYKALGLIYYKEGEWTLAKTSFESCVSLSPNHPDRPYIEGYLQRCREASRPMERHTGTISGMGWGS